MSKIVKLALKKPYPLQLEIIKDPARFKVLCCGRRFGKTVIAHREIANSLLKGEQIGYFTPTYKMLEKTWKDTSHRFRKIITEKSTQLKQFQTQTKGSIDFWSLDKADTIRGNFYDKIIVDEAAMVRGLEAAHNEVISPMLLDRKGKGLYLSTPKGNNYFKFLFDLQNTDIDWKSWQIPTYANPFIEDAEIDALRRRIPEIVFRQEILAEFVSLAGALLKSTHIRHYDYLPDNLDIVIGVDLAISQSEKADYTAICVMGRDADGKLYIIEIFRDRLSFHDTLQKILYFCEKYNPRQVGIEEVAYQSAAVQEFARICSYPIRGLRPRRGENKIMRFLGILGRYEQGLVYHNKALGKTFEEELLTFPESEHDDQVDSVSLSFEMYGLLLEKGVLF